MSYIDRLKNKIKNIVMNDEVSFVAQIPTQQTMKDFSERYTFSSLLPFERYDERHEIYFNTDHFGIMMICSPSTGLSTENISVLNGIFNQAYTTGTAIQVSMISDSNIEPIIDNWAKAKRFSKNSKNDQMFEMLAKNRQDHLKKGKWNSLVKSQPYILRDYHLIISITQPYPSGYDHSDIEGFQPDIEKMQRMQGAVISLLSTAGIPSRHLTPDVFINLLNGFFNPSKNQHPKFYYDEENILAQQLIDADTVIMPFQSGLSVKSENEQYSILPYHVRQFPKIWSATRNGELVGAFRNNILRIGCPFIATLTVLIPDATSTRSKAVANSTRATQMADSEIAKFIPEWADRKSDWQFTVESLDNGNRLLDSLFQVILLAPMGQEQSCEEALRSLYQSMGWMLSRSRYTALHCFLQAIPMGASMDITHAMKTFKYFKKTLSQTCTNIAPWVAEWKGHNNPMMIFSGRRGQITYFDPFENDKGNYNLSCCAASGSGKSFFTQEWIFNCLGSGGRAFVIDSGHSYRNLCNLLEGTYIDFGDYTNNLCMNPFTNIKDEFIKVNGYESSVSHFEEQLPMVKLLIMEMASGGEHEITKKQETFIERAIIKAWSDHKNMATVHDVIENLRKDDLEEEQQGEAWDLSIMLMPYSMDGMYGKYVNGINNIDLSNMFIVMDLDALNNKPDLQSVALLMLMMQITQVMYISGDKSQRKLCIIDEAWRLMGAGASHAAKSIEEGYRVARKHGGSFMTITQRISDYYSSETTKAAMMNSDFTIYLRQKPEELTIAVGNGYIDNSDGKVEILRGLETVQGQYSDLAISSPDGIAVMRLLVDPIATKIYSTQPQEVAYIKRRRESGISLLTAINELIAGQSIN